MYLAKDFIETKEGLVFAVVENGVEQGKVLCFLRYVFDKPHWLKLGTEQANTFLSENYPHYLYYSTEKQAHLHGVALDNVFKHHLPKLKIKQLMREEPQDEVEDDLTYLCSLMKDEGFDLKGLGVTGSILIGAQNKASDIDLVFYDRVVFNQARQIIKKLIQRGVCSELDEAEWRVSYQRRCCDLSFSDYLWHEQRKGNKVIIRQRKVDLSLVVEDQTPLINTYKKMGAIVFNVQIKDDSKAFDYPSEYRLSHSLISSIVCYTATYTGQAKAGEWVEVAGLVEQSNEGEKRVVVGSDREAKGEYIKVIRG